MNNSNRGRILGQRYQLGVPIASGSTATAYYAVDTRQGCPVAVKILNLSLLADAELVGRFVQESRAAAQLFHPNLVRVLDSGQDENGVPYVVTDLVRGQSLADLVRPGSSLPFDQGLHIAQDVTRGLAYAQQHGLIHGDIKPRDILVTAEGEAKLGDFGLTKRASIQTLARSASPASGAYYLSPETSRGEPSTVRSDLYSLGVILYQIFTGRVPFDGVSAADVVSQHQTAEPTPLRQLNPVIPIWLERAILRLLRKDPLQRYANTRELLTTLESASTQPLAADQQNALSRAATQRLPRLSGQPTSTGQPQMLQTGGLASRAQPTRKLSNHPQPTTPGDLIFSPASTHGTARTGQIHLGAPMPSRSTGNLTWLVFFLVVVGLVAVVLINFLPGQRSLQVVVNQHGASPTTIASTSQAAVPPATIATTPVVPTAASTETPVPPTDTPRPLPTPTPTLPQLLNQVSALRGLVQGGLSNGQLQPPGQEILDKLANMAQALQNGNTAEALKRVDEVGQRVDRLEREGKIKPAFAAEVRHRLQDLRTLLAASSSLQNVKSE